jgi:hypothetical protein
MMDDLLGDVVAFVRRYVVVPEGAALPVAAWGLYTHVADVFAVAPYLFVTSPTKRCGKSLLLELLAAIVCRPLVASNISEAALFRAVDQLRPTLLIDEAQILRERTERSAALHDLLCAGHRRGQKAVRVVGRGPEMEVRAFDVFGPKALALIGRPTEVLLDRGIEVRMHRRAPHEKVERFRLARVQAEASELRGRMAAWAAANREAVAKAYGELEPPDFLNDRAAENWAVLMAVVHAADPARLSELGQAARVLSGDSSEDDSPAVRLLSDLRRVFLEAAATRLETRIILQALWANEEAPWAGLTAEALARLLRPFGVRPRAWREGSRGGIRGYVLADLAPVFVRYLPAEPATDATAAPHADFLAPEPATARGGAQYTAPAQDAAVAGGAGSTQGDAPRALGDLLGSVPAGGEAAVRLRTFSLARERGFPRVEVRPGEFVGPGQAAWSLFIARAPLEQLAAAARALELM